MIGITLYRSLALGRGKKAPSPAQDALSKRLLFTNLLLGLGVLLVSGILTALSSIPAGI